MDIESRLLALVPHVEDLKSFVKEDVKLSKLVTFNVLASWDALRLNPNIQTLKQLQTQAVFSKFISSFLSSQGAIVLLQQLPQKEEEEFYDKRALFACAHSGTVDRLKDLLSEAPESVLLKLEDFDGAFLIHHAARGGNVEVIKYLLGCGVPVDLQSKQHKVARMTPLMEAVRANKVDAVKALLTYDAQLSSKFRSSEEKTAMDYASDAMKLEIRTHKLALRAGKIRIDPLPKPEPSASQVLPLTKSPIPAPSSVQHILQHHQAQSPHHNIVRAPHQVIGTDSLPPFASYVQTSKRPAYLPSQHQYHMMQYAHYQQQAHLQHQAHQHGPQAQPPSPKQQQGAKKAARLSNLQANLNRIKAPSSNGGAKPDVTKAVHIRSGESHALHEYQHIPDQSQQPPQHQSPPVPQHPQHMQQQHFHHPIFPAHYAQQQFQQRAAGLMADAPNGTKTSEDRTAASASGLPPGLVIPNSQKIQPQHLHQHHLQQHIQYPQQLSIQSQDQLQPFQEITFDGSIDMFSAHPEYRALNGSELAHELWNTVEALREQLEELRTEKSEQVRAPSQAPAPSNGDCAYCFDNEVCMVMIPCGHFILCKECAQLPACKANCIYCRMPVTESRQVYFVGA